VKYSNIQAVENRILNPGQMTSGLQIPKSQD